MQRGGTNFIEGEEGTSHLKRIANNRDYELTLAA